MGIHCLEALGRTPGFRPGAVSLEIPCMVEISLPHGDEEDNSISEQLFKLVRGLLSRYAPGANWNIWMKAIAHDRWSLERAKYLNSTLAVLYGQLGYRRFKVVRQLIYQLRFQLQPLNKSQIVQLEGQGASGPFGDAAVDFVSGREWRSVDDAMWDLLAETRAAETVGEWFDLHATV
eukprot:gnl/TRDRNA2_/TRDRNA2_165124_c0_seq1.p2 gnl/TRDRNA2_/TRDRNA2_165124_c0~~gnl/TRDRNA2_/TRDRNA2_165124_c0_seq1.p2  ORF type:complete len:177 (-),score=28.30 gnl/TRDRNA2_/TRDRNA2_165124_c0_seq1:73-603(-)